MIVLIKKFHVIIVAILVSFLASCAGKVESKTPTNTISSTISEPLAEVKTALQNQPHSLPVQVAIIMDKTGSVNWSRIEQPQLQDFQLLLPLLKKNGGEIAVGTFCYDSNRPLARIRLEQQPMLVNAGFNHPVVPVEPKNQGNAFLAFHWITGSIPQDTPYIVSPNHHDSPMTQTEIVPHLFCTIA